MDEHLIGVRLRETAPADDYVLWTQGGESDVWIATGRGLSHGIAGPDNQQQVR